MKRIQHQLVIIGGGPAGMSAALAAYDAGVRDLVILERDARLGGILQQCIHCGFGLHRFGEELTGPEYAARDRRRVEELKIPYKTGTMVLSLSPERVVTAMNPEEGIFEIEAGAVVLAMGCRERPAGALAIPGNRPAGVYTAGAAQKYVNMKGMMPGREVVILGSGDIGLIMARRMTLEGAHVHAVCELMPYSGGLARNIEQCLHDFGIPLKLSNTVTEIRGQKRLEGVTVSAVDENRRPIPGTEEYIPCDTLLLSCGLIPENELTKGAGIRLDRVTGGAEVDQRRMTSVPGVFACGNVLQVHDLVDFVSEEAAIAGRSAAEYLSNTHKNKKTPVSVVIKAGEGVRYTVPQRVSAAEDVTVYFRVTDVRRDVCLVARCGDKELLRKKKISVAPGEMETVPLKAADLAAADGREIVLSVEAQAKKEGQAK